MHLYHPLVFSNNGTGTCTLSGHPKVVATEPGLPDVTADQRTLGEGTYATLAPGQRAQLVLETQSECTAHPGGGGQSVPYHSVTVTLANGGTISETIQDNRFDLKCGLGASAFQPVRTSSPPPPPDPWRDLVVTVQGENASIVDGALVYEVDLTNTGSTEISFADRCPSYVEGMKSIPSGNAVAKGNYQLNCAGAPVIAAGATVRYEMKLPALDGIGGTDFTVTWNLDMVDPPTGTGNVVVAGDGTTSPTPEHATYDYTSPKGVVIKLDDFPSGKTISSPVTITGQVPGSWSFEADFPVVLTDWDGKIIAQGIGTLQGDWMTDKLVPFTVTLKFKAPTYQNTGSLILQKDNPSGESKFDDAVEIPVTFG